MGPPDPPKNCTIANRTTDTIWVDCVAGFDGGLPQTFFMEVYDSTTGVLHSNISSAEAVFLVTALRPGLSFLLVTYAANAKGRSDAAQMETFMLKVAEKRTGPPALFEFTPVLGILIGVVLAFVFSALVVIVVMKMRKRTPRGDSSAPNDELKGDLENKPLNVGVLAGRVKEGTSGAEAEDNNPDIIPHKTEVLTYHGYDSIDRGGHGGSPPEGPPTVRTLPRTHNQSTPGGSAVTYVELPLPRDAQPGYQVSATDLCLFAAKRRNVYLSAASRPSSPSAVATDPASVQFTSASTDNITTYRSPSVASPGPPVIHTILGCSEKPGTYALLVPTHVTNVPAAPPCMVTARASRSCSPAASMAAATLPRQRHNALTPGAFLTQRMTPVPRPRSMASLPTAPGPPLPTTTIYATTERRRSPNRQNTVAKSIHRRSLQSPVEFLDDRVMSRAPLMSSHSQVVAQRVPQTAVRVPGVPSRATRLRMPTESAV
ncbi:hypothetical protein GWK47_021504 [Chionoecetes opilio]|uniref:Fibronectin type-III domain-containing protein n=1 Tax=Chionoecetes opilio TaxID=41210 RepID=A0A8J4XP29_CHIOP|nr:hypothetical protein GWK47_021504 [Chionoecetes opilio]